MTYKEALDRIAGGGKMVRLEKLAAGAWTELHLTDPLQEQPKSKGPFLFVSLSGGDLVRWEPSADDRKATDWMAA